MNKENIDIKKIIEQFRDEISTIKSQVPEYQGLDDEQVFQKLLDESLIQNLGLKEFLKINEQDISNVTDSSEIRDRIKLFKNYVKSIGEELDSKKCKDLMKQYKKTVEMTLSKIINFKIKSMPYNVTDLQKIYAYIDKNDLEHNLPNKIMTQSAWYEELYKRLKLKNKVMFSKKFEELNKVGLISIVSHENKSYVMTDEFEKEFSKHYRDVRSNTRSEFFLSKQKYRLLRYLLGLYECYKGNAVHKKLTAESYETKFLELMLKVHLVISYFFESMRLMAMKNISTEFYENKYTTLIYEFEVPERAVFTNGCKAYLQYYYRLRKFMFDNESLYTILCFDVVFEQILKLVLDFELQVSN